MRDAPLADRVALVTGAGRGLGREAARWLSQAGADVVVCARSRDGIGALADELSAAGGRVLAEVCDVADADALAALVARAVERFGGIDIAVANAAILGPVGAIDKVAPTEWMETLRVNVGGTAAVARAVVPFMAARGFGRIVTLSGGGVGGPNAADHVSAYVASKGAVVVLTEVLAKELPDGVTINAVAPGAVPTGFMDDVLAVGPDIAGASLYDAVRAVTTPDLTPLRELLLYLVSEAPSWLSGRCLSARWDPPSTLREVVLRGVRESRFRLRRIDDDLYAAREGGDT